MTVTTNKKVPFLVYYIMYESRKSIVNHSRLEHNDLNQTQINYSKTRANYNPRES